MLVFAIYQNINLVDHKGLKLSVKNNNINEMRINSIKTEVLLGVEVNGRKHKK